MSQDKLKVRVVINQGEAEVAASPELKESPELKNTSRSTPGVEQSDVMMALKSGKMNETSDSYDIEELYAYNYRRIFWAIFLLVAFFIAVTSFFVQKINSSREGSEQSVTAVNDLQAENNQKTTRAEQKIQTVSVTDEPEIKSEIPAGSALINSSVAPIEASQKTPVKQAEMLQSPLAANPESLDVPALQSIQSAAITNQPVLSQNGQVGKASNVGVRILESRNVSNPLFLSSMIKKEPAEALRDQLIFDENSLIRVFFYAEVKGLKGKWLKQNWYREGKKVATVTSFVNSPVFKTHSSKFIRSSWAGVWEVDISVVDEQNTLPEKEKKLVEGRFDLVVGP